jgi:SAM-dependent methyltransferase
LRWILYLVLALVITPVAAVIFFYVFTKGALILRSLSHRARSPADHVYPIYSQMWLIRLVDFQPVISAILLCQYDRLVSRIVTELRKMSLQGQDVLITSCAFGNVIPRVVEASLGSGAREVKIVDIIGNELLHARGKLLQFDGQGGLPPGRRHSNGHADGFGGRNVLFFLLHELDPEMKRNAIGDAVRLLAPGGKLFLAEFHKPERAAPARTQLAVLQDLRALRPGPLGRAGPDCSVERHGRHALGAQYGAVRQLPGHRGDQGAGGLTLPPSGVACPC